MATEPTVDAIARVLGVGAGETVLAEFRAFWVAQGFADVPPLESRVATYTTLAAADGFALPTVATAADVENTFWRLYTP